MRKRVLSEIEHLVSGSLRDLLKKIHYPLEEAIDPKTHQKLIQEIATLLKCLSIMDNGSVISHCDRCEFRKFHVFPHAFTFII